MGRGKWQSLFATVEGHHEALEFDLLCRGLDLLDLWRGKLSWRRLWVIIQHLPRDAALWGSMRAAEAERRGVQVEPGFDVLEAMRYGELEHLTASLLDAVNWLVWSKTTDGAEGNNRPAPVHRPGQPPVRVEPAAIGWNDPLAQAYRAEMTTPE